MTECRLEGKILGGSLQGQAGENTPYAFITNHLRELADSQLKALFKATSVRENLARRGFQLFLAIPDVFVKLIQFQQQLQLKAPLPRPGDLPVLIAPPQLRNPGSSLQR